MYIKKELWTDDDAVWKIKILHDKNLKIDKGFTYVLAKGQAMSEAMMIYNLVTLLKNTAIFNQNIQ